MTMGHMNASMIRLSGVEYDKPVGKRLERGIDGALTKVPLLDARASAGRAINKGFATPEEAFSYIQRCDARCMFFAGTYSTDVGDGELDTGVDARVIPANAVEDAGKYFEHDDAPSFLTATKKHLAFREGAGLLHIDIDVKDASEIDTLWPADEVSRLKTAAEAVDALLEILPEAADCPIMAYPSSSSMIVDLATDEIVRGPGGWRILLVVNDARLATQILNVIHLRCWAMEKYRFAFLSKAGSFLERSLADLALGRPTQPDYPQADLGPGLAKAPDTTVIRNVNGPYLVAPNVSVDVATQALARKNIAAARDALNPRAEKVVVERKALEMKAAVKRGVTREAAKRAAERKFDAGVLLGSDVVRFAEGGEVGVAVLLSPEGEQYDERICFDPVEPDYDGGRAIGKFFWNDGVRPVVHSFAHGSKAYKLKYDAATAGDAVGLAGTSSKAIARIFAMLDADPIETQQLERQAAKALGLGNARAPLRAAVEAERMQIAGYRGKHEPNDDHDAVEAAGPLSLKEPLDRSSFPISELTLTGLKVLDHQDNIAHILSRYGIPYRYNLIRKDFDWSHPEVASGDGDNDEMSLFSALTSLCALNGVPSKNLGLHLVGLGARDEYNPVVDYLSSRLWEGKARFNDLADAMKADDPEIARIVIRNFLIQACAAADHCKQIASSHPEYRAHFEGILVLVGSQGAGKTKGLRKLIPRALWCYFKEGLVLNPKDKDSIKEAMSAWFVELGELEATFKKSDIATLKAFISRELDEIRLPYAPKHSRFHRRSVFSGTVNDTSFLADETGNRRFWPLTVSRLDVNWSDEEIDQLWAEAWARYIGGEQWWPSRDEEKLLAVNAERYRFKSAVEEAIENEFDWRAEPDWGAGRHTARDIYRMVQTSLIRGLDAPAMKTIGTTVRRLWIRSQYARMVNGVLSAIHPNGSPVRLNADGGENRGWYLPPRRGAVASSSNTTHSLIDLMSKRKEREP